MAGPWIEPVAGPWIEPVAGPFPEPQVRDSRKAGGSLVCIRPGEAVITSGHRLPNPWVNHCLGHVCGQDQPAGEFLASCYREALRLAEAPSLRSLAFPSLCTRAFGYPMEEAARITLATFMKRLSHLQRVWRIRLVPFDIEAPRVHRRALVGMAGAEAGP